MKFYDFVDKMPAIGPLVVVEGTESLFADGAIACIVERMLDAASRELNLERFIGPELESMEPVAAACAAMPFLGSARVIVVRRAEDMRAAQRHALWEVAQRVPAGNTLVIEDLQPSTKRTKPETFGQLAGRAALRIDTAPTVEARARYVRETLAHVHLTAEPSVVAALANGDSPLIAVRTDLEKLALCGPHITMDDLIRESIVGEDVKGYQAASALVKGDAEGALALAQEMMSSYGERGAGPPLLSAIAAEYRLVWELARPGGALPARFRWRERALLPIARRLGVARAKQGYERAVRGFESIVTGRAEDVRSIVAVLAALAKSEGREERGAQTSRSS